MEETVNSRPSLSSFDDEENSYNHRAKKYSNKSHKPKKYNTPRPTQKYRSPEGEPWRSLERDLTQTEYDKQYLSAINTCYYHLGSRAQTEQELVTRLKTKKDIPDPIIEEVLNKLKGYGYIDDMNYAETYITQQQHNYGMNRIKQHLISKGISRDLIEDVLSKIEQQKIDNQLISETEPVETEYDVALRLAEGRSSQLNKTDKQKAFRSLVGFLARRGFGGDIAYPVAKQTVDSLYENLAEEANENQ